MNKKKSTCNVKPQTVSEGCETFDCPEFDAYKDFKMEPTGHYVLIKVNFDLLRIEVAICDKDHQVVQVFRGQKCQDIYNAIFKFEKDKKIEWFKEKTHIAYLGKELKKAELALVMGNSAYFQE